MTFKLNSGQYKSKKYCFYKKTELFSDSHFTTMKKLGSFRLSALKAKADEMLCYVKYKNRFEKPRQKFPFAWFQVRVRDDIISFIRFSFSYAIAVIAICSSTIFTFSPALAQPPSSFLSAHEGNTTKLQSISRDSGQLVEFHVINSNPLVSFHFVQLVKDTEVQEIVKFDKSQLNLIDELIASGVENRFGRPHFSGDTGAAKDQEDQFIQAVRESLREEQLQRLIELDSLLLLRRNGLKWFLENRQIQDALEIDSRVAHSVLTELSAMRETFALKSNELIESSFSSILAVLDKKQDEELRKTLSVYLESRKPSLEFLAWQLTNLDAFSEDPFEGDIKQYRGFFISPSFIVDYQGSQKWITLDNWQRYAKLSRKEKLEVETYSAEHAFEFIYSALHTELVANDMDLVEYQVAMIDEKLMQYEAMNDERNSIAMRIPKSEKSRHPDLVRARQRSYDFCSRSVSDLDSLLLPHQLRQLKIAAELNEVLQAGLVSSLCYGQLGKRLNITAEQASEMKDVAASCSQKITDETRRMERELLEKLAKLLRENDAKLPLSPSLNDKLGRRVNIDRYFLMLPRERKTEQIPNNPNSL